MDYFCHKIKINKYYEFYILIYLSNNFFKIQKIKNIQLIN